MPETTAPAGADSTGAGDKAPSGPPGTVTITFQEEGKTVTCPRGSNLRKVARENGIAVYGGPNTIMNCLGNGMCGTDRVIVKPAEGASKRTFWENFHLSETPNVRLACRVAVEGDVTVSTKPAMEYGVQRKEELKLAGLAVVPGVILLGGIVLIVLDFLGKF